MMFITVGQNKETWSMAGGLAVDAVTKIGGQGKLHLKDILED
jgi:hypothetical protein